MRPSLPTIAILTATVIIGLGGFFFYKYGVTKYKEGYLTCQKEGAALATEAGEQLKNVIQKIYAPDSVTNELRINNWLRNKGDL